jgi:quercetin dioxygenase-like cupin family protein
MLGSHMSSQNFLPLMREPLLTALLPPENPAVKLVKGARIQFAPGQPTGLHKHPISTVGVVIRGSFHFQIEGQPKTLLKTGDCFFEPAGQTIEHFDNASQTDSAEIICFYLSDQEERPSIQMLPGGIEQQLGKQ